MRRVTLRDIAREVGTSPATVSKVLTGRGGDLISAVTRERIREVAQSLGYSPNLAARALVTGKTHCIALWAETLADYHALVANAFMDVLRPSQYEIVITDVVKHPDWRAYSHRDAPWPVDGIIALDSPHAVYVHLEASAGGRAPLVSAGAYYVRDVDHVGVALGPAVEAAVVHLAEQGVSRIAHLTCRHGMGPGDDRRESYLRAMERLGREPAVLVAENSCREDARALVGELIQGGELPDGLICFNDEMAVGAYRALTDAGIRIPDDVVLVGCDGIPDTEYFPCRLSTIVQPVEELCRTAWTYLKNRMDNPDMPRQTCVLEARLRVRESSLRCGGATAYHSRGAGRDPLDRDSEGDAPAPTART